MKEKTQAQKDKELKIERFCKEVVENGGNRTQAYIKAFQLDEDKTKNATKYAYDLAKKYPEIEEKIKYYESVKKFEEQESLVATEREIQVKLTIALRKTQNPNEVVKIAEILNRMNKTYEDERTIEEKEKEKAKKREQELELIKVKTMSTEDLLKNIDKISSAFSDEDFEETILDEDVILDEECLIKDE
jgi:hypothetical protein